MAATAGLDPRLAPFIAGYVLVLAILGPILAGHSRWLALAFTSSPPTAHRQSARPTKIGVHDGAPQAVLERSE
jgi:K+:H+ antiporter subunit KhtU